MAKQERNTYRRSNHAQTHGAFSFYSLDRPERVAIYAQWSPGSTLLYRGVVGSRVDSLVIDNDLFERSGLKLQRTGRCAVTVALRGEGKPFVDLAIDGEAGQRRKHDVNAPLFPSNLDKIGTHRTRRHPLGLAVTMTPDMRFQGYRWKRHPVEDDALGTACSACLFVSDQHPTWVTCNMMAAGSVSAQLFVRRRTADGDDHDASLDRLPQRRSQSRSEIDSEQVNQRIHTIWYAFANAQNGVQVLDQHQLHGVEGQLIVLDLMQRMLELEDEYLARDDCIVFDPWVRGALSSNLFRSPVDERRVSDLIGEMISKLTKVDDSLAFPLWCAFADLGIEPSQECFDALQTHFAAPDSTDRKEIAFATRWGLPVSQATGEFLLHMCDDTDNFFNQASAVETLAILGQLSAVPKSVFSEYLARAIQSAPSWLRRRRLDRLFRHPDNRTLLLDKLLVEGMEPTVKQQFAAMVSQAIAASRKLERYDFLTEQECSTYELAVRSYSSPSLAPGK